MQNIKRSSILFDKGPLNFNLYYTEKTPEYLCEKCGVILGSKQALKHNMVAKHSEKVTTYQCSKCLTTCNRLDNMRRHVKKHPGQTDTPKTIMYEIQHMSTEPQRPKGQRQRTLLLPPNHTSTAQLTQMTIYTSNHLGQTRDQYCARAQSISQRVDAG